MIASDVGGEELPAPVMAAVEDCLQHRFAARMFHLVQ
jgi:hypothetical protein